MSTRLPRHPRCHPRRHRHLDPRKRRTGPIERRSTLPAAGFPGGPNSTPFYRACGVSLFTLGPYLSSYLLNRVEDLSREFTHLLVEVSVLFIYLPLGGRV